MYMKKTSLNVDLLLALIGFLGLVAISIAIAYLVTYFNVQLPMCGEKGVSSSAIEEQFETERFAISGVNERGICAEILALEGDDVDRVTCTVDTVSEQHDVKFVSVIYKNTCRENGLKPLERKYYGVLTDGFLYPIFDLTYFMTHPDEQMLDEKIADGFITINQNVFEDVARYADQIDDSTLHYRLGQYIYYWGKIRGIQCTDMNVPESIQTYCLMSAVEDLYPNYDAYEPSMSILHTQFAYDCRDMQKNLKQGNDIYESCANYDAAQYGNIVHCFLAYPDSDDDIDILECAQRANDVLSEAYCDQLDAGLISDILFAQTPGKCYIAAAMQEHDVNICQKIEKDYQREDCVDVVNDLLEE